jgi:hypothetical protein
MGDAKTQDAVIRNFEIIGEAAQGIRQRYPDFIAIHPDLPWRSAYGMRNALTHGYFDVDLEQVWQAIHLGHGDPGRYPAHPQFVLRRRRLRRPACRRLPPDFKFHREAANAR